MPTTPPGPAPRRGAGVFTLLAVLAFVGLGAFLLLRRDQTPTVTQASPPPLPTTTLAPTAPPSMAAVESPAPSPEAASPEPSPAAATAAPTGPRGRRRAGSPSGAGTRVADAGMGTRLPPGPAMPPTGTGTRHFVLGTTNVESLKKVERDLQGFDRTGVGVKRAPEVNGRVEMEMTPGEVRPGVDYTVKVFLANDGDKDIPVQDLKIATVEDGKWTAHTFTPGVRTVKPRQRILLHETSGVWREAARSWAMEVTVTSSRQDVYKNRLSWQ